MQFIIIINQVILNNAPKTKLDNVLYYIYKQQLNTIPIPRYDVAKFVAGLGCKPLYECCHVSSQIRIYMCRKFIRNT
mgnify:CR=1 FL=1